MTKRRGPTDRALILFITQKAAFQPQAPSGKLIFARSLSDALFQRVPRGLSLAGLIAYGAAGLASRLAGGPALPAAAVLMYDVHPGRRNRRNVSHVFLQNKGWYYYI